MFEVEQMRTHKHAFIRPPSPPLIEEKISICQALLKLSPNQKTKDKRFRAWSDVQDKEEHKSWSFQYNDHWLICGLCSVSDHEIIFRYILVLVTRPHLFRSEGAFSVQDQIPTPIETGVL